MTEAYYELDPIACREGFAMGRNCTGDDKNDLVGFGERWIGKIFRATLDKDILTLQGEMAADLERSISKRQRESDKPIKLHISYAKEVTIFQAADYQGVVFNG